MDLFDETFRMTRQTARQYGIHQDCHSLIHKVSSPRFVAHAHRRHHGRVMYVLFYQSPHF